MVINASKIAERYGFTPRHWTRQAAAGLIPGAVQPSGPGGHWLFDQKAFAAHAKATGTPERIRPTPQIPKVRKPLRPSRVGDVVYIIYSAGHIKFGVSSNVTKRKHGFKTASPMPVHVLATIEGSIDAEARLHTRFATARHVGEWFILTPEVRAFVLQCQSGGRAEIELQWAEDEFRRLAGEIIAR